MDFSIPPEVADCLGYYVYLYVDPRTKRPFYVGKGQGARALAHLSAEGETRKAKILKELAEVGMQPRIEILAHALRSEEMALRIEAAAIDLLGLDNLANLIAGWRTSQWGRTPLDELVFQYAAKPVHIDDPVILIRINRLYRPGMSAAALYDATRSCWKLSNRRKRATYALAVFEGVVREVYQIERWHPGGTTQCQNPNPRYEGRWEFTGRVADKLVRQKYFGKSVAGYFPRGLRAPVTYANVAPDAGPSAEGMMSRPAWNWKLGPVDTAHEHLRISYGDINTQDSEQWVPVALVSAPTGMTFSAQFLIEANDAESRTMLDAVRSELDFYLVLNQAKSSIHCGGGY